MSKLVKLQEQLPGTRESSFSRVAVCMRKVPLSYWTQSTQQLRQTFQNRKAVWMAEKKKPLHWSSCCLLSAGTACSLWVAEEARMMLILRRCGGKWLQWQPQMSQCNVSILCWHFRKKLLLSAVSSILTLILASGHSNISGWWCMARSMLN